MSHVNENVLKPIVAEARVEEVDPDVYYYLSRAVEYHLKDIIQEAQKVKSHTKRRKLCPDDVNTALRLRSLECIYGYASSREVIKISGPDSGEAKAASGAAAAAGGGGGGSDGPAAAEVVDLSRAAEAPLPRLPVAPTYALHWLAVDGAQPGLPQNPSRHPPSAAAAAGKKRKGGGGGGPALEVSGVAPHELSRELQDYYKRVVAALGGLDAEGCRAAALRGLARDAGLQPLLPYLARLVAKEVTRHLGDLGRLRAALAAAAALLRNPHLHPELYLHQLMPAVLTCLVGRGLGGHPGEDHWEVRRRAARLAAEVCRRYGATYATLAPRCARTLVTALADARRPLPTHFGAVAGLTALGPRAVERLLLPDLPRYADALEKELSCGKEEQEELDPTRRAEITQTAHALQEAAGFYLQALTRDLANSNVRAQPWKINYKGNRGKRAGESKGNKTQKIKTEEEIAKDIEEQAAAAAAAGGAARGLQERYAEALLPYWAAAAWAFPAQRLAGCFL